jgi:hypothetical protein
MNSWPCKVPLTFAAEFIGRSPKTLINWKSMGRAPFLGHFDNNGRLSRRLYVDVRALVDYLILECRHETARRFIDAVIGLVQTEQRIVRKLE